MTKQKNASSAALSAKNTSTGKPKSKAVKSAGSKTVGKVAVKSKTAGKVGSTTQKSAGKKQPPNTSSSSKTGKATEKGGSSKKKTPSTSAKTKGKTQLPPASTKGKKGTAKSKNSKNKSKNTEKQTKKEVKVVKEKVEIPSYRQLKNNLYRPPLQRPPFDINSPENLECSCTVEGGGCGEDCQNRLLYTECIPDLCKCTKTDPTSNSKEFCQNTVIQRRAFPQTEVFKTPQCGYGLRMLEDIPSNTIITEYLGEVITTDEMYERMRSYRPNDNVYFASLGAHCMLDANHMGSIARFANHSCEPNSQMQKWSVKNESRIVLVSLRPLKTGEEITYNYQFYRLDQGEGSTRKRHVQVCHCGSKLCTGIVGGSTGSNAGIEPGEEEILEVRLTRILQRTENYIRHFTTFSSNECSSSSNSSSSNSDSFVLIMESVQGLIEQCRDMINAAQNMKGELIGKLKSDLSILQSYWETYKAWEDQVTSLTSTGGLMKREEFERLLSTCPYAWHKIKSKYIQMCKNTLIQHKQVCQNLYEYRTSLSLDCSLLVPYVTQTKPNSAQQASTPGVISKHEIIQLFRWEFVMAIMKQFDEQDFPLYVPYFIDMFTQYFHLNLFAKKHFHKHIPSLFCDIKHREHSLLSRIYSLFLQSITPQTKGEGDKTILNLTSLPLDLLTAMSHLNSFLNIAIARDSLLKKKRITNTNTVSSTVENSQQDGEPDTESTLYCVCQMTESDSYCSDFTQCSSCNDWYHLPCLNHDPSSHRQAQKGNSLFCCSFCVLEKMGSVSTFAYIPSTEWKFNKAIAKKTELQNKNKTALIPSTKVAQSETKKRKAGSEDVIENDNKASDDHIQSTIQDINQDNHQENNIANISAIDGGTPKVSLQIPMDENAMLEALLDSIDQHEMIIPKVEARHLIDGIQKYHVNPSSRNTNTGPHKQFFTYEELQKIFDEAISSLQIYDSPTMNIVELMLKKVRDWESRVVNFLYHSSTIETIYSQINSNHNCKDLVGYHRHLLLLYYELYAYRIKHHHYLEIIRVLIWTIAISPLITFIAQASNSSSDMKAKLSIEDLVELDRACSWISKKISSPSFFFKNDSLTSIKSSTISNLPNIRQLIISNTAKYVKIIQTFIKTVQESIHMVHHTKTSVDAIRIYAKLESFKPVVMIDQTFEMAKVKCLLRPAQLKLQITQLEENLQNLEKQATLKIETHILKRSNGDEDSKCQESAMLPVEDSEVESALNELINHGNNTILEDAKYENFNDVRSPDEIVAQSNVNNEKLEKTKKDLAVLQSFLVPQSNLEGTEEEIYCYCRKGDDKAMMVACDRCEDWFHARCVGIRTNQGKKVAPTTDSSTENAVMVGTHASKKRKASGTNAKKSRITAEDEYLCISCSAIMGREYPYIW